MKVIDCIECPKCHKRFLKKQNPQGTLDWYCHNCREGYSTHELVYQWGLDAGDLFGGNTSPLYTIHRQFSGYPEGEPYWYSVSERDDSYQMVTRMFLDIPEIDDYTDMIRTYADGLDVGIQ